MQESQICPDHTHPILKKSQTKSCCKMLSVLFNSEKHNQLFHHYDSESIYVLFQVMYEVYIEKIMTGTVFGYLILFNIDFNDCNSPFSP